MPKIIETPDGLVEFPDSMDDKAIQSALDTHYKVAAKPSAAPESNWTRIPKMLASNALGGATNFADFVGSIYGGGRKDIERATGKPVPTMNQLAAGAGLVDQPGQAPQGFGERIAAGAARGIGSNLALGPAGLLGGPLMALGSAAGGGAAAELAHEAMPDSKWAPVAAGLAGGLATGAALGGAKGVVDTARAGQAVNRTKSALDAADNNLVGAPSRAEIAAKRVTDFDERELAKVQAAKTVEEAQALHDNMMTEAQARAEAGLAQKQIQADQALETATAGHLARQQKFVTEADQAVESMAARSGAAKTFQEAGSALQDASRKWLKEVMPAKQAEAWAPVDAAIAPETQSTLHGFARALEDITSANENIAPLAQMLRPRLPEQLKTVFDKIAESPAGTKGAPAKTAPTGLVGPDGQPIMKTVTEAVPPKPFTWDDSRKLRTLLGEALADPTTVKDIGQQQLSRLYAAITGDMKATAKGAGAEKLFEEANSASTKLYDLAQGPVAKIVASPKAALAEDAGPGAVVQRLLTAAGKDNVELAALRAEMPEAVDQLGAVAIRQGHWEKLSPEAQALLVPDAERRAFLTDLPSIRKAADKEVTKLVDEAKASHKAQLDAAREESAQSVERAKITVKSVLEARKQVASEQVAGVTARQSRENKTTAAELARLREARSAAAAEHEAALAEQAKLQTNPLALAKSEHQLVASLAAGSAGSYLGSLAASVAPGVLGTAASPALGAIGAISPLVLHGLGTMVHNPAALRAPVYGAVGGLGQTRQGR